MTGGVADDRFQQREATRVKRMTGIRTVCLAFVVLSVCPGFAEDISPSPEFQILAQFVDDVERRGWPSQTSARRTFLPACTKLQASTAEYVIPHLHRAKSPLAVQFAKLDGFEKEVVSVHEGFELEQLRAYGFDVGDDVPIERARIAHQRALVVETFFVWLNAIDNHRFVGLKQDTCRYGPTRAFGFYSKFHAENSLAAKQEWGYGEELTDEQIDLLVKFAHKKSWGTHRSASLLEIYRRRLQTIKLIQATHELDEASEELSDVLRKHYWGVALNVLRDTESIAKESPAIDRLSTSQLRAGVIEFLREVLNDLSRQEPKADSTGELVIKTAAGDVFSNKSDVDLGGRIFRKNLAKILLSKKGR